MYPRNTRRMMFNGRVCWWLRFLFIATVYRDSFLQSKWHEITVGHTVISFLQSTLQRQIFMKCKPENELQILCRVQRFDKMDEVHFDFNVN
jgi:hypothetical protein